MEVVERLQPLVFLLALKCLEAPREALQRRAIPVSLLWYGFMTVAACSVV